SCMRRRVLGVAASAHERDHPLAAFPRARGRVRAFDDPCDLQPWNLRSAGRRGVVPLALHDVGAVDRGRSHLDEQLTRTKYGTLDRDDLQDFGPAESLQANGSHRDPPNERLACARSHAPWTARHVLYLAPMVSWPS